MATPKDKKKDDEYRDPLPVRVARALATGAGSALDGVVKLDKTLQAGWDRDVEIAKKVGSKAAELGGKAVDAVRDTSVAKALQGADRATGDVLLGVTPAEANGDPPAPERKPTDAPAPDAETAPSSVPPPGPGQQPPAPAQIPESGVPQPPTPATPPPAPGGLETVSATSSGGTRRTTVELKPEEIEEQKKREALTEQAIAAKREETLVNAAKATAEELSAKEKLALQLKRQDETNDEIKAAEADVAQRKAAADAEEAKEKQLLADFYNPKNGYWNRADTMTKVRGGLALILGFFGGANDGSNVGAERIKEAVAEDVATRRQQIEDQRKIVERARGDVQGAKDNLKWRLDVLDLKYAVGLEAAASQAESRLKALGVPEAQIAGNQGILELRRTAADTRVKWLEGQRTQVEAHRAWSKVQQARNPAGAAGDKPIDQWSGPEKQAEGFAQRLESSYQAMQKHQYTPADVQAIKNAAFHEKVLPKAANAIRERLGGTLFEKLSPSGKQRFLAEQEFAKANLRRESGATIGVEEMLTEVRDIGQMPGETPETAAQKQQNALRRIASTGISSGRPMYWQNRAAQMAVMPASSNPATAGRTLPSGAVAGVDRKTGKRGYMFNGQFYATE